MAGIRRNHFRMPKVKLVGCLSRGPSAWMHPGRENLWESDLPSNGSRGTTVSVISFLALSEDEGYTLSKNTLDEGGRHTNLCTYASLLRSCVKEKTLSHGKRIHTYILKCGLEQKKPLGNLLLQMYGSCGSLEDACAYFAKLYDRDLFSWNCVIKAYARNGQGKNALQLLAQMQHEGLTADKFIFISLLSICASETALSAGKCIHSCITHTELESDIALGTVLVNMYGKWSSVSGSCKAFDRMPEHDAVSWTAMIAICAQHGEGDNALKLFDQMQQEGMMPDKVTFVSIIDACASAAALPPGKRLHARIVSSGFESDVVMGTALVNMYGECGSIGKARGLFDNIVDPNMISWNALLAVYAQNGHGKGTLQVFEQMQQQGIVPNKVTFLSLFRACVSPLVIREGQRAHARIMWSGFKSDANVVTALVDMYGKCGNLKDARRIFNDMPEHDVVSWNAMIAAYAQHGQGRDALLLFDQMQKRGVTPDKVTFITILSACASQVALAEGKLVHNTIESTDFKADATVGNALISMYGKCGDLEDAKNVFNKMTERDHVTFVNILSACANQAGLAAGRRIHQNIMVGGAHMDVIMGNALVNLYGKCGTLQDARRIFEDMPERDVVSWTALIAAYAQHGKGKDALYFFSQMQKDKVTPNDVTFLSVLSACSHAGLLDEGNSCFKSMTGDHGITPSVDHYNCMIDLFGRVGQLQAAENFVNNMPCQPSVVSWTTLLGACRVLVDVKRGEHAAINALQLDPNNAAPCVILANIYAAAGRVDDAMKLMNVMKDKGFQKELGCSSIEVKGRIHKFYVDDQQHPHREQIYAELQNLSKQMEEQGYVPDMKFGPHFLEGEGHLCSHSESLALVFGLISSPPGVPIFITKNLPLCSDCHSSAKFLSQLTDREIIMRDTNRFHHMNAGACSCADYWRIPIGKCSECIV